MPKKDEPTVRFKTGGIIFALRNRKIKKQNKLLLEKYHHMVKTGKKSPEEVLNFVLNKYPTKSIPDNDPRLKIIAINVIPNFYPEEIKKDVDIFDQRDELYDIAVNKLNLDMRCYCVLNEGNGKSLYDEDMRKDKKMNDIYYSIELVTGWGSVSNSMKLSNEIIVYRGLDEMQVKDDNYVIWYLRAMQNLGILSKD